MATLYAGFDYVYKQSDEPLGIAFKALFYFYVNIGIGDNIRVYADTGRIKHVTNDYVIEIIDLNDLVSRVAQDTTRLLFVWDGETYYIVDADENSLDLIYVDSGEDNIISAPPENVLFFSLPNPNTMEFPLPSTLGAPRLLAERDLETIYREMKKERKGLYYIYDISRRLADEGKVEYAWHTTGELKELVEVSHNLE